MHIKARVLFGRPLLEPRVQNVMSRREPCYEHPRRAGFPENRPWGLESGSAVSRIAQLDHAWSYAAA